MVLEEVPRIIGEKKLFIFNETSNFIDIIMYFYMLHIMSDSRNIFDWIMRENFQLRIMSFMSFCFCSKNIHKNVDFNSFLGIFNIKDVRL